MPVDVIVSKELFHHNVFKSSQNRQIGRGPGLETVPVIRRSNVGMDVDQFSSIFSGFQFLDEIGQYPAWVLGR